MFTVWLDDTVSLRKKKKLESRNSSQQANLTPSQSMPYIDYCMDLCKLVQKMKNIVEQQPH